MSDRGVIPDRGGVAGGRVIRCTGSREASVGVVSVWALLFGTLAALPGLVALGVGLVLVEVLVVSVVTGAALFAAALMVGGFPGRRRRPVDGAARQLRPTAEASDLLDAKG